MTLEELRQLDRQTLEKIAAREKDLDGMIPDRVTARNARKIIEEMAAANRTPPTSPAVSQMIDPQQSGSFMSNVNNSFAGAGQSMWDAVANAPQIYNQVTTNPGGTWEAVKDYYGDRYGSLEDAGSTFYQDPVGAMMDVSMVGSALRLPGMLSRPLGRAARAIESLDPITASINAGRGIGIAGSSMTGGSAAGDVAGLYSTPKGRNRDVATNRRIVNDALDRGITPDEAGAARVEGLLSEAGDDISRMVDSATAQQIQQIVEGTYEGTNRSEVISQLRDLQTTFRGPGAKQKIKAIDEIIDDIDAKNLVDSYLPDEMWRDRKLWDKAINWESASAKEVARQEGYKAGAGVLRQQIDSNVPEVRAPMREYGRLKDIESIVEPSAIRDLRNKPTPTRHATLEGAFDVGANIITGRDRMGRAAFRRALETGDWKGILDGSSRTWRGDVRAGMYVTGDEDRWRVGRLTENN